MLCRNSCCGLDRYSRPRTGGCLDAMSESAGLLCSFFFQAEDGIRDLTVTGVQTCALPIYLETALVRPVKITVTKGLTQPWSMAFLPDGSILVTERGGKLRRIRDGKLDPNPVEGLPAVQAQGLAGLMDIQLHPKFAENKYVYLTYHRPQPGAAAAPPPAAGGRGPQAPPGIVTLARAKWNGNKLVELKEIFSGPAAGSPS